MPGPILWGPNNTANNLQTNITQTGIYRGAGAALPWTASTSYTAGDVVWNGGWNYVCLTTNTSGSTFAADFALGYWEEVSQPIVGKNYMANGSNFESNAVEGWAAAKSGTMSNAFPTAVGTGGNPFSSSNGGTTASTLSAPAVTSTNPLAGKYSLNMATTSGGTTAGDMYISQAYAIDIEDQAKALTFKFAYQLVSDTNSLTDFSGSTSNTFGVAIYDVVNNAWIQPAGVFNIIQKTGVGYCTGTFQTASNSTKLQLAVYCATATGATTISFYLDDFYMGPQPFSMGPAMSDYVSFTPTGSWTTNSTYTGYWARQGDSAIFKMRVATSGAPTSTTLTFNIPFGWNIDTAKIPNNTSDQGLLGQGAATDNAVATYPVGVYSNGSATSVRINAINAGGTYGSATAVNATVPFTFGNGDMVDVTFSVPIVGWSSNTVQSADTDTRVITATVSKSGTQSITGGVSTKVTSWTVNSDDAGMWDNSNNRFNIAVSGYYRISSIIRVSSASVSASYKVNGGSVIAISGFQAVLISGSVKSLTKLNAGDYVELFAYTGANDTISASDTMFQIERLSGPAIVQATDTVAAVYYTTAGNSINSATIIDFGTKVFDTTNSVTTGASWKFTAPVSGKYMINSNILFDSAAYTTPQNIYLNLHVNGTLNKRLGSIAIAANATLYIGVWGSAEVNLKAGDYIDLRGSNERGATALLNTDAAYNYVCVTRVGN